MLPLESRSDTNLAGPAPHSNVNSPDIAARCAMLVAEHDDLDYAITALLEANMRDDLLIKRLKKRKLHLKDEIALAAVAG